MFIGIIAVVRRVVVITAEVEGLPQEGRALTNFLLELGLLSLLVIAFALSIYLIRRRLSGRALSRRPSPTVFRRPVDATQGNGRVSGRVPASC